VGVPQSLTDAINGNVLQDALRDDATYEYMFLYLWFKHTGTSSSTAERYISYAIPLDYEGQSVPWSDGGISQLNSLIIQGWNIDRILSGDTNESNDSFYIYQLKRPIEE
jgi:hypothetical protein